MVVEVIEINYFLTDDEDVAQKLIKHFGIIIFVHKINQRQNSKLPFLIIPTQEKETEEFFLDQLSKVQCGSIKNGLSFIKFTLKIQQGQCLKESNLMLIVQPAFETKFMEVWTKILPNSKKPRTLDEEKLKSEQTFLSKASVISNRFEDLTEYYGKQISSMRDQMMLSLYANFMTQHVSLKKKELLTKLREEEFRNLPKFIKIHSEFTTLDFWISDSVTYTINHQCNLQARKKCKNFGLKKCSRCRVARYCNSNCQTEDWKSHAAECQRWGEHYRTHFLFLGDTLMDILRRRIPGDVKLRITFEEFMALLSAKMFELNFELITDRRFHQNILKQGTRFDEFVSADECRNLLRGPPGRKEDVRIQLEEVWGKNKVFEVFDKPAPQPQRFSVFDYSRLFGRVASGIRLAGSFLF